MTNEKGFLWVTSRMTNDSKAVVQKLLSIQSIHDLIIQQRHSETTGFQVTINIQVDIHWLGVPF